MKLGSIFCLCVLMLVPVLLEGCASNRADPAVAGDAAPKNKGHWVTLPPQTGSLIPQRIWVKDSGDAKASPSMNNVQNGSAADMQRMQNNAQIFRPGSTTGR